MKYLPFIIVLLTVIILVFFIKKERYTSSPLTHTAYYANWAQFWNGGATFDVNGNPIQNCPSTFNNFLTNGNVSKIIYGVVMFGISPNPTLMCAPVAANFGTAGNACQYVRSNNNMSDIGSMMFGVVISTEGDSEITFANKAVESLMNSSDLQTFVEGLISPFPKNPPIFITTNNFYTYPMYPNICFTGSEPVDNTVWGIFTRNSPTCPSKGRINDFDAFNQLRSLPNVKLIASYGGWTWTHGEALFYPASQNMFSTMVSNYANRSAFIEGSYGFLTSQGFSGADFDWEYPGENGSSYDFYGFEQLISEFKFAHPDFLLSMQCSGFLSWDAQYDTPLPGYTETITMANDNDYFKWINRLIIAGLDNVNIMAYDYYTATTANSPIPKNGSLYCTRPNTPMYCGLQTDIPYSNDPYPWINSTLKPTDYNGQISTSVEKYTSPTSDPTCKYTVQPNDYYYAIATKYGITSQDLETMNNNISLQPGTVLSVPCLKPVCGKPYTVQSGDTLSSIASQVGITYQYLSSYNNLQSSVLALGQVLNIPCPKPVCGKPYTVQSGDTLSSIASQVGITSASLLSYNLLKSSSLSLGQVLVIPCPPPVCGKPYTIQTGDTLSKIASQIGITAQDISTANNNLESSLLTVGQVINIPCPVPVPAVASPATLTPDINSGVGECLLKTLTVMQKALGANMEKVVMGLACYGRSFSGVDFSSILNDTSLSQQQLNNNLIQFSVGLPCAGGGWIGPPNAYVNEPGVLTYYDLTENCQWTITGYNEKYGISVAVNVPEGLWVSYDSPEAIEKKMALAKSFGVGGVMSFTPQQDDWTNGYPIISTIGANL